MSASIEGVNGDDEGDDSSAMEGGDRDGGHDDGFDVPLYDSVIALKLAPGALPCMPLRSMHHPQLVELSGESFDVLTRARSGSRGGPEYWGLFSEGEDGSVCTTGVYCRLIHAPYQGYQGGLYDAVIGRKVLVLAHHRIEITSPSPAHITQSFEPEVDVKHITFDDRTSTADLLYNIPGFRPGVDEDDQMLTTAFKKEADLVQAYVNEIENADADDKS